MDQAGGRHQQQGLETLLAGECHCTCCHTASCTGGEEPEAVAAVAVRCDTTGIAPCSAAGSTNSKGRDRCCRKTHLCLACP